MDQMFDDSFFPTLKLTPSRMPTNPALNVIEQKDKYKITLKIPGINPKDVSVEIHDKVLTLSYEHKDSQVEEGDQYLRQEYSFNSFSRSIALPKNVQENSIKADYEKGILKVEVMKSPESQPKKIEIEIKE
jgi:HSP20 family protein